MKSICALDIGTLNTRALIASNENGNIKIKGFLKEHSLGVRKGIVFDVGECSNVLYKILSDAKKIDSSSIFNIYVNVGTVETKIHLSCASTIIAGEGNEISQEDVDKVLASAQNSLNLEKNRKIVHSILNDYIIDDVKGILDPIGISGNKLEGCYLIIESFEPHIKNIIKAVNLAKGKVKGLVFNPISSSRSVLSKIQKELGTVLIDIGYATTSIAIYEENKLIYSKILPIGSSNISSDIAIGLKIPYDVAEEIKMKYGYAFAKEVGSKEYIEPDEFGRKFENKISKKFLAEIIEARLSEIFELINKEIKSLNKNLELSGGALICGGGSKIPGLVDLAKKELKLSIQIGLPINQNFIFENYEFENYFNDPENANVFGLTLLAKEYEGWQSKPKSFLEKIKTIFNYFNP